MLLGPLKIIPAFAGLTRGADVRFKRDVAIRGALTAAVLCAIVALIGGTILDRYRISIDAVRLAGGLVLLIAALQLIFPKKQPQQSVSGTPAAMQLAVSPVAIPMIVPPAGIAAILIMMLLAPQYPGMPQAVAICLAIIMVLNFLVMHFIDQVMKIPGLMLILALLGTILIFVQAALAMQMFVVAFKSLGLFTA
ncbi:MAG: MarC family protein [Rubrivivax sp.]|nr:MarC family protein [Rubrivivax sp.]